MDSQNLPCPRCPQICHSSGELISHLRSKHRLTEDEIQALRGRGYFEEKTVTRDGDVAINHRDAAVRAQASTALNVPMVYKEQKRIASPPAGWVKTLEGFQYEKLILHQNTINSIIKKVLKGSVIANHAILELFIYKKDVGELLELEKSERLLDAELDGGVTGDTEYLETVPGIVEKLLKIRQKIKAIKNDSDADTEKEIYLEDWFSGDIGEDAYVEWQEKFMGKALLVAEDVQKEHAPKQEIKL